MSTAIGAGGRSAKIAGRGFAAATSSHAALPSRSTWSADERYCSPWAARVSQAVGGITRMSRPNRSGARTAAWSVVARTHRCAAHIDAIEAELVQEGEQVGGELGPLVGGRVDGSTGLAVPGGVVADDLVTAGGDRVPAQQREQVLAGAAAGEAVTRHEGRAPAEPMVGEGRHGWRR